MFNLKKFYLKVTDLILNNINLVIPPYKITAIVGRSGAGKSIQKNLKLLICNDILRKKIIVEGINLVDGKGAERIVNEINSLVIQDD